MGVSTYADHFLLLITTYCKGIPIKKRVPCGG
jgi:hypothetical protein